jgi:hypothetical protein
MARPWIGYAVAAATAAATASIVVSMMATRGMSHETRVTPDASGRARAPAQLEALTSRIAPVAANRSSTRVDDAGAFALTADSIERAVADVLPNRRDLVLSELLDRLVSHNAPAAARIAENEADGYLREVALRVVAQSWTKRDAVAAVNWAASLSDQDGRDTALENAALELAVSQPRLALQALDRRSAPRSPDPTLEGVVQQWATNDFTAAYAWAQAQPAGPDRDALLTRLVFVRAAQDPAEAARIVNSAFSADAQRIAALSTIAHIWGARDPMAVQELALTLDAKAQRQVRSELALLEPNAGGGAR